MLRLACGLCALGVAHAGAFVRGDHTEAGGSAGASDPALSDAAAQLQHAQRIDELERQLAELRRSLDICTAEPTNALSNASVVAAVARQSQQRAALIGLVSPPVDDLVVAREYTSYNWEAETGNGDNDDDGVDRDGGASEFDADTTEFDADDEDGRGTRRLEDEEKKPIIGVCLASTSKTKKSHGTGFSVIPLFKVLLPSLANTVEPGYEYRVYVGVDSGDTFYDNDKNEKEILQWFDKNVATKATILGAHVSLKVILFVNKDHKPGPAFNKACRIAYDEGADYFYRVNDDSEFKTTFAKPFAELENRCPPNIGVTGPTCHEGNTHILTHDFTHRHHMEIFHGQYYPIELTDWWLDDWVTHVYGVHHTSRVLDVVVRHRIDAAGTRYSVNHAAKNKLQQLQTSANDAIRKYIADTFPDSDCDQPLGPVSKELRVSAKPEFFSAIPGVRGIVLDPEGEDNAHHARHVANNRECSHVCQTSTKCVAYTWIGEDNTPGVLGTLKAILSIGSSDSSSADGAGVCYLFDAQQAPKLRKAQFHSRGQSGVKKKNVGLFDERLQSLLSHVDPMNKDQFSSSVIRVSFGGGKVDGWLIDEGSVSKSTKSPVTGKKEGAFGWNCDLTKDVRARGQPGFSDLLNNNQILSRQDKCASPRWAIQLPNGIYRVVVGYSDTQEQVVVENCKLNGAPAHDGSEMSGSYFEYQSFQQIQDGQLVFSGKYSKRCMSIAFMIIDEATHYFG